MSEVNLQGDSINPAQRIEVPDLAGLINRKINRALQSLNCVSVGTIQSFDASKQTAVVSINYKALIGDVVKSYPLLVDCPVVVLGGGLGNMTFPIAAGDTCVILFSDRSLDTWFSSGIVDAVPESQRIHDLSDGIALVGIRALNNLIVGYNVNGVQLFHGDAQVFLQDGASATVQLGNGQVIQITPSGIVINNNGSALIQIDSKVTIQGGVTTLKVALDSLCQALLSWVDSSGDSPNPATQTAITAAKLLIDTVLG